MTIITKPGFVDGLPSDVYHSPDCTPEPALSSSGARAIEDECPAYFWHHYLNPEREDKRKRAFDIGTSLHLLVLEPHLFEERTVEVEADDWRTKDARDARDRAHAAGRVPLLTHEVAKVKAMRDAIFRHPVARLAFEGGVAERSYFWRDPETGIWCKARPDYAPAHLRYFTDVKAMASANPRQFERSVWEYGYHMQAAWYLDAREAIDGVRPDRFAFIVVGKEPPHLVTPVWLGDETLQWGALQNRRARRTFAECLAKGEWPGYRDPERPGRDSAFTVSLPPWARNELQREHEAGRFVVESDFASRALAAGQNPFT